MHRRRLISVCAAAVVADGSAARAEPAPGTHRLCYLALLPNEDSTLMKPMVERLAELGYLDGRNLILSYRSAEGVAARLPELAAACVAERPAVLVAGFGTLAAQAAKAASSTIPVVFTSVGDPIGADIVASLRRPGGNVTGVSSQASEIVAKRLQIAEELAGGPLPVAVLVNPQTPYGRLALEQARELTARRGQRLEAYPSTTPEQVTRAIAAAKQSGAAALLTLEDPFLLSLRHEIVAETARLRLPLIAGTRELVDAGGLMSYGVHRADLNRRAADYVDRILKGARPADLPVEQPTKFEFVVNLKAARAQDIRLPERLLFSADQVVE